MIHTLLSTPVRLDEVGTSWTCSKILLRRDMSERVKELYGAGWDAELASGFVNRGSIGRKPKTETATVYEGDAKMMDNTFVSGNGVPIAVESAPPSESVDTPPAFPTLPLSETPSTLPYPNSATINTSSTMSSDIPAQMAQLSTSLAEVRRTVAYLQEVNRVNYDLFQNMDGFLDM